MGALFRLRRDESLTEVVYHLMDSRRGQEAGMEARRNMFLEHRTELNRKRFMPSLEGTAEGNGPPVIASCLREFVTAPREALLSYGDGL
eukprot:1506754-Amphidinium_carterae.1